MQNIDLILRSYLGLLIPDLKSIVTDPIPEVRTMAAVAMGSLVSGIILLHFLSTLYLPLCSV
jgi:hypothetical protein